MATFLSLVNKVIMEGGFEMTPLTEDTWESAEAGRRRYPYIKAKVNESWAILQMERNEWHFGSKEITKELLPRFLISDITVTSGTGPAVGTKYKGENSGLELEVLAISAGHTSEEWLLDFSTSGSYSRALLGETFNEVSPTKNASSFTYLGRGSYKCSEFDVLMREPSWTTFVCYQNNITPVATTYIPWENWLYKEVSNTTSIHTPPLFVSQDYRGDLTFYPQTLSPFTVNFVYNTAPHELVNYDDEPLTELLPAEYHYWIAWEALSDIASYDKNPDLKAYADRNVKFFKNRAERNLMPPVQWGSNKYNRRFYTNRSRI